MQFLDKFIPGTVFTATLRDVAVMAEMGISPQKEKANPQGMKLFAVGRPGLPEDFVPFPALCEVQSLPLVLF